MGNFFTKEKQFDVSQLDVQRLQINGFSKDETLNIIQNKEHLESISLNVYYKVRKHHYRRNRTHSLEWTTSPQGFNSQFTKFIKTYHPNSQFAKLMKTYENDEIERLVRLMIERQKLITNECNKSFARCSSEEFEISLSSEIFSFIGNIDFNNKEWVWNHYGANCMKISQADFIRYFLGFGFITGDIPYDDGKHWAMMMDFLN